MMQQDRILIIEDHAIVVWGLKGIMEDKFPDYSVHTAPTFDHGFSFIEKNAVTLIVLDIDVPGGSNSRMIETLRRVQPEVKILIHTAASEQDASIDYLTAGADGFLSKNAPFETIEKALGIVLAGEKYMSQQTQSIIAKSYLNSLAKKTTVPSKIKLTPREVDIITLLIKGKWTKEISDELGIKLSTVSTHKLRIFEKFDVTNEIQLYQKIQKYMPELITTESGTSNFKSDYL
jgi:two-component system invasion response regulator UvrY